MILILMPFQNHGAVFGGNGDTPFALQIHVVHQPFGNLLAFAKQTALTEHGIHQGGFAVVNMGDNGNIADGIVLSHSCFLY